MIYFCLCLFHSSLRPSPEAVIAPLKDVIVMAQQRKFVLNHDLWKRLRQRSKISLSKDRFDRKLLLLERRIDGLRKIRKQAVGLSAIHKKKTDTRIPLSLSSISQVRLASIKLYGALGTSWKCSTSVEHEVNLSLAVNALVTKDTNQTVSFDMAWLCPTAPQQDDGVWLSVKTMTGNVVKDAELPKLDGLRLLTSQLDSDLNFINRAEQDRSSQMPKTVQGPDLCDKQDLCNYVFETSTPAQGAIGYLELSEPKHIHSIIIAKRLTLSTNLETLSEALHGARSKTHLIPFVDKVHMARCLTTAALRFHATPWLYHTWQSKDILLLGIDDWSGSHCLESEPKTPFLKAKVHRGGKSRQTTQQQQNSEFVQHSEVQNRLLMNLAVILLEIAYDSPFGDLNIPDEEQGDLLGEVWKMKYLADKVERIMGPIYGDAVKACLHGLPELLDGDNSMVEKQETFIGQVAGRLEKLAEEFIRRVE